ncbi:MAG: aspartate/glutamate racemase family protein [Rhodospirillaceae bacterium]|nr:aspartate/glutamate racemase family protein [Rhodospirillaceae bacterium]
MKTIGLIGGMSWESSAEYYRLINQQVKARLGGLHSAKILMFSLDFAEIEKLQSQGQWDQAGEILIDAAQRLEKGGADFLLLCTNTMHKLAGDIQQNISLPLLHIADATGLEIKKTTIKKIGLLGTKFTMEQDFYKGRLKDQFGFEVLIPDAADRQMVHDVIYRELCLGTIQSASKEKYKKIIHNLVNRGVEGVILGCTEISLLINQKDSSVPLFDTTKIHAAAAVDKAL